MKDWCRSCYMLMVLLMLVATNSGAAPITFHLKEGNVLKKQSFDLSNPKIRAKFLEHFKDDKRISVCNLKAKLAVTTMEDRDEGISLEEQLDFLREKYEREKPKHHIYVDVVRMVNDVYRRNSSRADGEFQFTDANELWKRQFLFCYLPGRTIRDGF